MNRQMKTNIKDFEIASKLQLEGCIFDFIYGGAADEVTSDENKKSYWQLKLIPKILSGVQDPDTSTSLFGQTLQMPILIAPMGFQKISHPNGELETAQGAKQAGTVMVVSTYSMTPLKEIAENSATAPWFQLYILKDRDITKSMVELAENLGYHALVLTVDAPIYGNRERELRNPLTMNIMLPDLKRIIQQLSLKLELSNAKHFNSLLDPNITWKDIEWIKSITGLPIILKGILRADDAQKAVEYGVAGIIISNHGGRQLDTTPATIKMLPMIAETIDNKLEILIDGGIRRGTDILKALALGAKAVLIGRPILWGLCTEGKTGVYKVLDLLQQDLKTTMILCGCQKLNDISSDLIVKNLNSQLYFHE